MNITEMTMYRACLLHTRADRTLRAVVSMHLESYGITRMEWLLLATVGEGPMGGRSMSSLASTLDVSLPQLTALTIGLLGHKLVRQTTSTRDRRSRDISATPKGVKLIKDVEHTMRGALRVWLADIPREQLEIYMRTVQQLAAEEPTKPDKNT